MAGSKFKPGTRVRVTVPLTRLDFSGMGEDQVFHDATGTVRPCNYSADQEATAVLLDKEYDPDQLEAFFHDYELEEVSA